MNRYIMNIMVLIHKNLENCKGSINIKKERKQVLVCLLFFNFFYKFIIFNNLSKMRLDSCHFVLEEFLHGPQDEYYHSFSSESVIHAPRNSHCQLISFQKPCA